ncbi:aminoglycoside phosphotransferase family protein [Variovorax sp. ZS18.2.2]|uniref:phosphotransferase family protein n=1 Tax=Variovorax sp. ZS18.2.2 TaxID=2971255 RepID=UPI002151C892|nr:aminoglycoside phosphotransferase family protein [Variovorax sp. ZS18.2.2]MCR6480411.1 aminoglycoside phosphotransferase family protein [Variovorax sp. ZS18.2.2]
MAFQGITLDSLILERLLAPTDLMQQIARHVQLDGALLLSAEPRDVDAPGYLSDLAGVTLTWTGRNDAPTRAVLKVSHAGFGQPELPFYENVAKRLNCPVVPDFYGGGIDESTGRTWLLMEDLSASHERPSDAPLPPSFARNVQIVEALARFHAAGWNKDGWHDMGPTMWARLRSSDWLEAGCDQLFAQAGDAVDDRTRNAYARFRLGFPALIEQAERLRGRTLIHGDAHVWNWMLPREGINDEPKLLDWDGWHLGVGAWDLAYMMAVQWDRGVRQRFEMPLLDRYHTALSASGVTGYSRETLQEDYRLAVLLHMRTPIARFVRKMSAYVWWPQLTRIQDAVDDLRCLDLVT